MTRILRAFACRLCSWTFHTQAELDSHYVVEHGQTR